MIRHERSKDWKDCCRTVSAGKFILRAYPCSRDNAHQHAMGTTNGGFTPSEDFPPADCREGEKMVAWFRDVFEAVPMKEPAILTSREKALLRLSAQEYVEERKHGKVSCEEYTSLLVRRACYYRYMNQWTFRSYELFEVAVLRAKSLDEVAKREGVEAIAPLYGLPIPMKGTAAVVDFPAGCGVGILSYYTPVKNSELTDLIYHRNGIILGTTNVPEFAASTNTMNIASGQCRNPYNHAFLPGGSSGGAASAVSMHMCPVAVSEDTGGSTRVPALCNGLFGFDPARNYYPNEGNAGMTVTRDQIGVVCRSMADVIFYDKALMQDRFNAAALHSAAETEAKDRQLSSIRVAWNFDVFVDFLICVFPVSITRDSWYNLSLYLCLHILHKTRPRLLVLKLYLKYWLLLLGWKRTYIFVGLNLSDWQVKSPQLYWSLDNFETTSIKYASFSLVMSGESRIFSGGLSTETLFLWRRSTVRLCDAWCLWSCESCVAWNEAIGSELVWIRAFCRGRNDIHGFSRTSGPFCIWIPECSSEYQRNCRSHCPGGCTQSSTSIL